MAFFKHSGLRFKSRQSLAVAFVGIVAIASVTGCSKPRADVAQQASPSVEAQSETSAETETVLVSSDGTSQLTLPPGWKPENQLHDSAELQAANPARKLYVIVLSESKDALKKEEPDTTWTLETHSQTTRKLLEDRLKGAGEVKQEGPVSLRVGPYDALQYEIQGKLSDMDVAYLHTTVETPTHFHQILAWTEADALAENRAEIDRVIQSFQEITKPKGEAERENGSESPAADETSSDVQPSASPQNESSASETTNNQAQ